MLLLGALMFIAGGLAQAFPRGEAAGCAAIPKILETPKGDNDKYDRIDLALPRELAGAS